MKVCNICKVEKNLSDFAIRDNGNHRNDCKQCRSLYLKEYRRGNKDNPYKSEIKATKICRVCKFEKPVDEFIKSKRICKPCQKEYLRNRYLENKEIELLNSKIRYQENKQEIKQKASDYYKNNKDKVNKRNKDYRKKRLSEDPILIMKDRISNKIRRSLNNLGIKKSKTTSQILGCSLENFKIYLESLFEDGMSWQNRNMWDLDHIVPISFAENENEVILLNHYTNLRPLWKKDNLSKSNNIIIKNEIYYRILELRLIS